ncbi:MAG: hypothetical protein ABSC51_01925 [Gaiellaceae bacterium]|jgi:hypothetical protein
MTVEQIRAPSEFETRLARFLYERFEEARALRVGEKEVSEQAAIVARYADLFSRAQLAALAEAEQEAKSRAASADELERLYRLRKTCEGGIVAAELAEREDRLENEILAARATWKDEEIPLRSAQALLAVLDSYGDRDELGEQQAELSARFNAGRLELIAAAEALEAELSGQLDPTKRSEEKKGISLHELEGVLTEVSAQLDKRWGELRERWFDRLLGPDRDDLPRQHHVAYMRRLSPLASTYTAERATEVCLGTLAQLGFRLAEMPNIRLDLDDRPQKSPRACVIASDPPAVVHLITRAQGGLHDYEAFLHEAGHALHYGGCDPALPYAFRSLSRDHALTEIYSYLSAKVVNEPGWHARYFSLPEETARENAEAGLFIELQLFRRYVAKLQFELEFWGRFAADGGTADGYSERQQAATGVRYRPDWFLADMDSGFYSADYLRAWVRSAQLRASLIEEVGEDWWRSPKTGELLRSLFAEGTRPSSEEIAVRLGFEPLDCAPLLAELGASGT